VVKLTDGTEKTISAGDSYTVPPGHDALNPGKENVGALEVLSADVLARPAKKRRMRAAGASCRAPARRGRKKLEGRAW
jgi:hypothetical protein